MNCPSCNKEVMADRLFCTWCESFMPNIMAGKKAGLFRRWFASFIDPVLAIVLYLVVGVVIGGMAGGAGSVVSEEAGVGAFITTMVVVTIAYGGFFLYLLSKGMTPGKWLLGEQVVERLRGDYPGFWKMILREVIGKFVSGLFLGLGYLWAIWDKDNQVLYPNTAYFERRV